MVKISKKDLEKRNMSLNSKKNKRTSSSSKNVTKKNNNISKRSISRESNAKSKIKTDVVEKSQKKNKSIVDLPSREPKEEIKPKKENQNHGKLLSILSILALSIFLVVSICFSYPKVKERIEIKKLNAEVDTIIDDLSNNKINIDNVTNNFKNNLTSSIRLKVENNVEEYILFLLSKKNEVTSIITNDLLINSLNTSNIGKQDVLNYYDDSREKLSIILSQINDSKEKYYNIDIDDDRLLTLNNRLINKVYDKFDFSDVTFSLKYMDDTIDAIKFLINNSNFYDLSNGSLIFLKRSKYEEYQNLIKDLNYNNISNPNLIEDKTPPVITLENITIYKGNSVNLNEKIKCIDEVDDAVECNINGTYNSSKVGDYTLTITSEDKSGNVASKNMKVTVKEKVNRVNTNNKPYYIEVIRNQNVVIVYGLDNNKEYTKVVKVFVASVGRNGKTPVGTFKTTKGQTWGYLIGGVVGQYSTRIVGSILFHSVPYYSTNKGDLEWEEYNKLGTAASAGCVRMTVRDVKWIFDNVSSGTTVRIYDGSLPSGISKPSAPKIPANSPNRGWDPTDPDPNNPWNK